jgi:chaperone protein DnaJ
MAQDLYAVLGVARTAPHDEIKRAYRKLAKKLHPDVNPGDKKSEERFKEVSSAFEVLGDEKKRALYDEFGEVATRTGFDEKKARAIREYERAARDSGRSETFDFGGGRGGGGGFDAGDFSEMFGDLFARRRGRSPRGTRPEPMVGADVESELEVDLRDAVLGADHDVQVRRPQRCPECHGTTHRVGSRPYTCPDCKGSGEVKIAGNLRGPCPRCQGEGTIQDPCPRCKGEGFIEESSRLRVKIPPGVETGSRVRLPGQGGLGEHGGANGDLYLRLHVRPHALVRVEGRDLSLDLPVTAAEALRGADVTAPTFEGPVTLKVPPGSQSGRKLRLRGRGLPALKGGPTGAPRGDLYVVLQIQLPPDGEEARAAVEKLEKLYLTDVRRDVRL